MSAEPNMLSSLVALDTLPKVCIGLLALLLFSLSVAITVVRMRSQTWFGVPLDPSNLLTKLVRTQGNTAEYAGVLAVLILLLGAPARPDWVSGMMVLAVVARVLFAIGMLTQSDLARFNIVHAIGAGGTYVAGLGLSLAVLFT